MSRRALIVIASTLATAGLALAQQSATISGTLDGHAEAAYAVAWTPDGKSVVSGGFDKSVRIWDVASRKETRRFDGHTGLVLTVAVDKDGKQILSGSLDKTAKVWEIPPAGPSKVFADNPGRVRSIAQSPDGKQFAAAAGKVVRIWDVETSRPIRDLSGATDDVESVAWSADGSLVASGDKAKMIRFWNPADGSARGTIETPSDTVLGLAFLPDNRHLISAGSDGIARLWEWPDSPMLMPVAVRTFEGHKGPIHGLATSADGKTLATASADKSVKVFEVDTGKERLGTCSATPRPSARSRSRGTA